MTNPKSALHGFSTGNLKSLKFKTQQEQKELRDALRAYWTYWYSSNIMSLVVVGNHELDELEDMVRKYFAQIVNK